MNGTGNSQKWLSCCIFRIDFLSCQQQAVAHPSCKWHHSKSHHQTSAHQPWHGLFNNN